jgi:hypothetical protein
MRKEAAMPFPRARIVVVAVGLAFGLAGCETSDLLDKVQDLNPFGTAKTPLPGDRRVVFPEGVPGVQQGVPPDLMKGAQQHPDPNAPAAEVQVAAPPAAKPVKPRPQRAARPAPRRQPTQPTAAPAEAAAPRPARATRRAPAAAPAQQQQSGETAWPSPGSAPAPTTVWPDPPQPGQFSR